MPKVSPAPLFGVRVRQRRARARVAAGGLEGEEEGVPIRPARCDAQTQVSQSVSASDSLVQHNANDWKMMRTAASVVHDCLFSKLRHELFANARRTRKRALESKVVQYAKRCKRQHKFIYVAHFNRIAIESGFFSNANYETISRAQNPKATTRALAPLLVSLFKTLNAGNDTPLFKCVSRVCGVSAVHDHEEGESPQRASYSRNKKRRQIATAS